MGSKSRMFQQSSSLSTLVSTEWLSDNARRVKIIDGSWHMPSTQRRGGIEFLEKRIKVIINLITRKDAVFFDIDQIADQSSNLPHMLPNATLFSQKMGDLGISESDHIVIYDSSGFGPACRVFWTFRVFGHENVSVLNGGLFKWMLENRPVESGPIQQVKKVIYDSDF